MDSLREGQSGLQRPGQAAHALRRISFFYQKDLDATTAKLTADLHELSTRLTSLAPPTEPASFPPSPRRIPLSEHIKARVRLKCTLLNRATELIARNAQWNEKLAYGLHQVQQASIVDIAAATWAKGRALLPPGGTGTEETKA